MAITVTCSCGGRFKAPDEAAGRTARCPSCHAPLVIPAADAESAVQYLELKPGEPPAPEAPPAVAPVGRRANRLGIASLVLGILALLISWIPILGLAAWPLAGIGIILGIVGIVLAARTRRVGYASAITGTVLGVAAIGVTVVVSSLLGRALREARRQADADLAKLQQVAPPAGPLPAPTLLPPEPAKAAAPAAPDGTIAGLDRNGDGRLSADEVPEERRVQFGAIDADRDGYVDAGEWARADEGSPARGQVIAQRLFTVADDFVVDVYHNGERVPIERREMIAEAFGATEEKIDVEVREGDWLVFNVANNRLRWNGWYYFAAAGVNDGEPHIGFTTELDSGRWSYCDDPGQVPAFIAHPRYLADHRALPIATPWDQGDARIKQRVPGWKGVPVWGERRNTWIKFVAPPAASPGAHPEAEPGIPAEAPRAEAEPGPGAGPRPSEERPVKSTAPTAPAIPLGAQPGEVRRFDVGGVEVGAVAWSHDGRSVLCGAHDKLLHLWDVETGRERLRIAGHTDRLTGVAFTPDDRMAVSTGGDFTARVWDLTDGHEVRKFAEHTDLVHSVAITTDGRRVV
ncbi:MAG TPA: hypothetical protein VF590_09710, partial [Isosphaeraceae bacterium]